jgi:hypothetical protein
LIVVFFASMDQTEKLYCISSGASATSEIERDIMLAEAFGADAKVDFISERLEKHEKFFLHKLLFHGLLAPIFDMHHNY